MTFPIYLCNRMEFMFIDNCVIIPKMKNMLCFKNKKNVRFCLQPEYIMYNEIPNEIPKYQCK